MRPAAALAALMNHWSPCMLFEAIRRQLGRSVPFARLVGIEVVSIDGQCAVTRIPADERLGNHVSTVHAGALFTLCESASGAALAGAIAQVIMQTRLVVRDAQVEYLKPARGEVFAKACLVDEVACVLEALRRDGRADMAVDVSATTRLADGTETLVARASFNWHLRLASARNEVAG
jgi:thioesterase domain-containing protein